MHGAARLMFGQNPEVLPTKTPTTMASNTTPMDHEQLSQHPSITTAASVTSVTMTSDSEKSEAAVPESNDSDPGQTEMPAIAPTLITKHHLEQAPETAADNAAPTDDGTTPLSLPAGPLPGPMLKSNRKSLKAKKEDEPPRQVIGDVIVDETADLRRKPTARRSVSLAPMSPKVFISLPLSHFRSHDA